MRMSKLDNASSRHWRAHMCEECGPISSRLPRRAFLGAGAAVAAGAGVLGWRAALAQDHHDEPEWSYEGEEGPDHWGSMSDEWSACAAGTQQSPINIIADQAEDHDLPNIQTHYGVLETWVVEQTHHTVRVTVNDGVHVNHDAYALFNDQRWNLKQFHFHSPSEHAKDGWREAMELHMVHELDGDTSEDKKKLVVGILLALGNHNDELALVFDVMADLPRSAQQVHGPLELDFFQPMTVESFRYIGSLTTPPCTVGVQWIVYREPNQISEEQLNKFLAIQSENARPAREPNPGEVVEDITT